MITNRVKFVVLLMFVTIFCNSQNRAPKGFIYITATPDNVEKVFAFENPNLEQLDTIIQLGRNYTQVNRDTSLEIIELAINWSQDRTEKEWRNFYARSLSSKGAALENDKGIEIALQAKEVFESVHNRRGMASSDRILGVLHMSKGHYNESINYYISCIKTYTEEKTDPRALLNPLEGIADIYFVQGNYPKAQEYLSKAIMIADTTDLFHKESGLRRDQSNHYLAFAKSFNDSLVLELDKSKQEYFSKAFDKYKRLALEEAAIALELAENLNDPSERIECLYVLANLKIYEKQFELSLKNALEMLDLATKVGAPLSIVRAKLMCASSYKEMNNDSRALRYAKEANSLAIDKGLIPEVIKISDLLIHTYIKIGDATKAISNLEQKEKYLQFQNELSNKKTIAEAEAKYQISEKENKILMQKNNILELEAKNEIIRKNNYYFLFGTFLVSLLLFFWNRINKIKKDRNDKIAFAEALIMTQEEERKRIASDLHDGVGQNLLLIKRRLSKSNELNEEGKKMVSDTLEEVRSISRDLHPFQLDKFGLTCSIESILEKVESSTDIFISKQIENIDSLIPKPSQIHLYRSIQEIMNNLIKHSQATAAKVIIENNAGLLHIQIRDNGIGFNLEHAQSTSKSLGIRTMHERVSAVGGELLIAKGEVTGTIIKISIPIS